MYLSNDELMKNWVRDHSELRDGTWRKIKGEELTQEDIGLEVRYLHFIAWEYDTYNVHGILKQVSPHVREYHFAAEIVHQDRDGQSFHGSVYGDILYVKKRVA